MEELKAADRPLIGILDELHKSELALPEFQREYIWKQTDITALISSVIKGYPAGALLFWNYDQKKNELGIKGLAEVEIKDKKDIKFLVLDGQQRLTTLYNAFFGKGKYRLFFDLNELYKTIKEDSSIDEEKVIIIKNMNDVKKENLNEIKTQLEKKLYPLEALFYQHNEFSKDWKTECRKLIKENDKIVEFLEWFDIIEKNFLHRIEGYRFGVINLPKDLDLEAVCQIFEGLNSKGVRLGIFELLTAKLYPYEIKLKDKWEATKSEPPLLLGETQFNIDPVELLKTISLIRIGTLKRKDILKLKADNFIKDWDLCAKHLKSVLNLLKQQHGVINRKWLPYISILSPMTALHIKIDSLKGAEKTKALDKIMSWYWFSVFSKRYDASTDTTSMKDYASMLKWIAGEESKEKELKINELIKNFDSKTLDLKTITDSGEAMYKGIICLIIRNGAEDFYEGTKVQTENEAENKLDDHHIFPIKYLEEQKINMIDTIINKTLLKASTNRTIQKSSPKDYLKSIENVLGQERVKEILNKHLIPEKSSKENNYDKFIEEREMLLKGEIAKAIKI